MSLFGTPPDDSFPEAASQSRNSLFDDNNQSAATAPQSSLFSDELDKPDSSSWGIPAPKKTREDPVKTLLQTSDVPDSYIDVFDSVLRSGNRLGTGISLTGIKNVLGGSGLNAEIQQHILNIVMPGGEETLAGIGRGEFNVLLALIGLAQEGEDMTLDGVDERRHNLPEPSLASLSFAKPAKVSDTPEESTHPPAPATPARNRPASTIKPSGIARDEIDFTDSDPWASPAQTRGSKIGSETAFGASKTHSASGSRVISLIDDEPVTTFNTTSVAQRESEEPPEGVPHQEPSSSQPNGWSPYDGTPDEGFSQPRNPDAGDVGFGRPGNGDRDRSNSGRPPRSFGGGRVTGRGVEENISVMMLPEKEGVFMFQHRNYEVSSIRRGSKVIRRYSDFVWLLDCLQKRYPFRQLPLLPPKRVAVNGRHLSSDVSFIEKRRRGLTRFSNALVRHPVLSQEQLVIMFLTVPTELSVWRKQATISIQEEFTNKALPPNLEDSLPSTLPDLFDTVRLGVRRSAEVYINLCNLVERLTKRKEGIAADSLRISLALHSLQDMSESTYATDTNDVPLLNEGLKSTANHLSANQSLLEDEARAWDEGVLEDLKRHRDTLVAVRDIFDRRDRYAKDNIPYLERRIELNEIKLQTLRNKPQETLKAGEIERVEQAIIKDKQSIVAQHARGILIKECIRDELIFFQQSQYHVSRLHQDWSQERVKYAELQADNWRALSEEVEGMPLGE
ncbi:MAG: Sorting nexin mvp1 [Trizodia sp. TS-e1964]|nr:MAG: Sorting nexin mvp1 [Trizodia sp. TS-e1964]